MEAFSFVGMATAALAGFALALGVGGALARFVAMVKNYRYAKSLEEALTFKNRQWLDAQAALNAANQRITDLEKQIEMMKGPYRGAVLS